MLKLLLFVVLDLKIYYSTFVNNYLKNCEYLFPNYLCPLYLQLGLLRLRHIHQMLKQDTRQNH